MPAVLHPIVWLAETLRQWRARERQVATEERADESAADLCHPANTAFWYLPPPC